MNKLVLVAFLLLFNFSASAHAYFFAFAELEYNEFSQTIEGTFIFTTHDLEDAILKHSGTSLKFDKLAHDSLSKSVLEKEIKAGFSCISGEQNITFSVEDFLVTNRGTIEVYVLSNKFEIASELRFQFSALMDIFTEQENKLTFIFRGVKETLSFTPQLNERQLKLEN